MLNYDLRGILLLYVLPPIYMAKKNEDSELRSKSEQ